MGKKEDSVVKAVNSPMMTVWLMVIMFVIYSVTCSGPSSKPDPKYAEAEQQLQAAREEGARALAEADAAIRNDIEARRQRLTAAARSVRKVNSGGVLTEVYDMPDGRIISCNTIVYPTGPIMNCDGDV